MAPLRRPLALGLRPCGRDWGRTQWRSWPVRILELAPLAGSVADSLDSSGPVLVDGPIQAHDSNKKFPRSTRHLSRLALPHKLVCSHLASTIYIFYTCDTFFYSINAQLNDIAYRDLACGFKLQLTELIKNHLIFTTRQICHGLRVFASVRIRDNRWLRTNSNQDSILHG